MPRIRTVKPELARHRELYALEKSTGLPIRFAWAMLPCVCDREGRFLWRPWALKLDVLPYDDVDFDDVMSVLHQNGFVEKYEVGGEAYGHIPTFLKHQRPNNKESKSTIPSPSSGRIIEPLYLEKAPLNLDEAKLRKVKGSLILPSILTEERLSEEKKPINSSKDTRVNYPLNLEKASLNLDQGEREREEGEEEEEKELKGDFGKSPLADEFSNTEQNWFEKNSAAEKKPLDTPPEGVKLPNTPKRPGRKTHPATPQLVAAYIRAFQSRFNGTRPHVSAKLTGQISSYLADVGLEAAVANIEKYFAIEDEWFAKKGYDFSTFLANQNQIITYEPPKKLLNIEYYQAMWAKEGPQ